MKSPRQDVTVREAREIQERLRDRVDASDRLSQVRTIAGVDVSYDRGSPHLYAAAVLLDAESLEVVARAGVRQKARFPYVPGYLSFRELPAAIEAFERLPREADLVVCDGHGFAHPRRFGLACHFGVSTGVPTIGCAKSVLVGRYREPGPRRGAATRLLDGDEVIGRAVRTRDGVKPVFASVGHKVSLSTAARWILRAAPRFRLPEPVRQAHAEVNRLRVSGKAR